MPPIRLAALDPARLEQDLSPSVLAFWPPGQHVGSIWAVTIGCPCGGMAQSLNWGEQMLLLSLLAVKNPDLVPKLDLKVHVMEIVYDPEHQEETWKRYTKDSIVMYDFNGQKDDSYGMVFDMYLRRMVWPSNLQVDPVLPSSPVSMDFLHQVTACYVDSMVEGIYAGRRSGDGWRIHKRAVNTAFGSILSGQAQDCNPKLREDLVRQAPISSAAGFEMTLEVETRRENYRGQTTPLLRLKAPEYIAENLADVPKPYVEVSVSHPVEQYAFSGGYVPLAEIEQFTDQAERALWACYTQSNSADWSQAAMGELLLELHFDSLGSVVFGQLRNSPPGLQDTGLCFLEVYKQLIVAAPLNQTEGVVVVELPLLVGLD